LDYEEVFHKLRGLFSQYFGFYEGWQILFDKDYRGFIVYEEIYDEVYEKNKAIEIHEIFVLEEHRSTGVFHYMLNTLRNRCKGTPILGKVRMDATEKEKAILIYLTLGAKLVEIDEDEQTITICLE
jgi:GNAT superfamily N-acetyltransferase